MIARWYELEMMDDCRSMCWPTVCQVLLACQLLCLEGSSPRLTSAKRRSMRVLVHRRQASDSLFRQSAMLYTVLFVE